MTTIFNPGPMTFPATDAAVEPNRRMFLQPDGKVRYAAAGEKSIGLSMNIVPAAGSEVRGRTVAVAPLNTDGAMIFTASGAIARGAEFQAAADGKVATGAGLGWVCVSPDITADGDQLIAFPLN